MAGLVTRYSSQTVSKYLLKNETKHEPRSQPGKINFISNYERNTRQMNKYYLFAVLTIACFVIHAEAGLRIVSATNLTIVGSYAATPIYFFNSPTQWNISGELIPLAKADTLDDLTNKIVLIPRVRGFKWVDVALPIQKKGALGLLSQSHNFFNLVTGAEMFYDYTPESNQWIIPYNSLPKKEWDTISGAFLDVESSATVILDSYDANEWQLMSQSGWMVAWQVILSAFGIASVIIGIYLIILIFRSSRKVSVTTMLLSLILITFGAAWRTIYALANPFMFRRTWYREVDDVFLTTNAPFTFAPMFLIALYQHELMKKTTMQANMFLNKMQIPFYVAIGVLFAVEIVISILRGQGTDQYVAYVNIILYLLVALVFSVFFVVTSIRVALFIRKVRKMNPKRKSLQKTTTLLAFSTLAQAMFIITLAFFLVDDFVKPVNYTVTWFFVYVSLYLISLIHLITYLLNKDSITASRSGSSHISNPSTAQKGSTGGTHTGTETNQMEMTL